ncbi:glycosyltransferase [Geobacillus kaustophilus NBRC 102445]|uniref:glycosyltransferase family 4 protein n=1 Tax=Geobacillus thermoleovorans group TaxID=1505648 RepID=UPI0005AB3EFF|nr:glycosyltransferase family 4 protein [Geobacillus kaustophilus]MED4974614.1 glycosyltransferase family 4 protein [Geobacillus thermoleovorans]QCK81229.1 glycosyltransferase [Geobacillus kaustophilus NBRC 102445]
MKVCVVGPVHTDKYFGGVALFTESVADGFLRLGHDVKIITDYANKSTTLKGVPIISVSNNISRRKITTLKKIRKKVEQFNPDILISSLEYSIAFIRRNKKLKEVKRIHFVHGFPSIKHYGFLKMLIMLLLDKLCARYFERIFINSNFAFMINNDIYKNRIDKVINIGLGYDFLEELKNVSEVKNIVNSKILFVGRLVSAKKVDVILSAINYIKTKYGIECELDIVGTGPQEEKLKELAQKFKLKVNFIGNVSPKDTIKFYRNSEIFISLNPHEPFGMVYLEALANGCKIVCPNSGGQLDFLIDYLDRVKFTNAFDYVSVGESIMQMLGKQVQPINSKEIIEKYSYDNVVKKILNSF